jgi:hypothetical protein
MKTPKRLVEEMPHHMCAVMAGILESTARALKAKSAKISDSNLDALAAAERRDLLDHIKAHATMSETVEYSVETILDAAHKHAGEQILATPSGSVKQWPHLLAVN